MLWKADRWAFNIQRSSFQNKGMDTKLKRYIEIKTIAFTVNVFLVLPCSQNGVVYCNDVQNKLPWITVCFVCCLFTYQVHRCHAPCDFSLLLLTLVSTWQGVRSGIFSIKKIIFLALGNELIKALTLTGLSNIEQCRRKVLLSMTCDAICCLLYC